MKNTILFLLLFSCSISNNAQIARDTSQRQNENRNNVTGQSKIDSIAIIEKVYLQIDRKYFFPGDDIWFKAYLINAADRLLSDHSNNLHVELISPSSKIIAGRIIKLESGLGNGDFKLPEDLISGKYYIRAYTNYMRNFSDQLFFNKEIIVVNSNKEKDENTDEIKYVENSISINFFPEGGSLVDNVSSLVAFKAVDNLGKGCDVSGRIFSSKGDLIATFRSTHLGMGSFLVKPLPGLSYYAIYKGVDSLETRTELPKSYSDGVSLRAEINQNNELILETKSNPQTFNPDSDNDLFLRISARNEVIKTILCKIKYPDTYFVIPADDLPDGVLMLTLLNLDDITLAERLIYSQKVAPLRIHVETDKLIYEKRDRVSLKISMSADSTSDMSGNVSLSVADKKLTDNLAGNPGNIASWFLLESDVRGIVEDPSYYFDPSKMERLKNLDLLLLTQGWRDFAWKYDKRPFHKEKGFTISGRLRRYYLNRAIENSRVSIGIFGNTNSYLTTVPADSSGRFRLSGIDLTGDARLIVTGIGKKDRLQGMLDLDSTIYIPAKVQDRLPRVSLTADHKSGILRSYYVINESIRKKYKLSDTIGLGEVKIIAKRQDDPQTVKIKSSRSYYGTPDNEVIVTQQMQSYPYLIDILRGRVPGVEVTGSFPDYRIIIRGFSSINAQGPPLVLIDGIPAGFEDLISMPIPSIERIDVLKQIGSASVFGFRGANGVINLITKAGEWAPVPVSYSENIKISGYYASRIFYSPQHLDDSKSAYGPDLRSTLLWEPEIILDSNKEVILDFYNGDNSSIFKIMVEGMTLSGIPLTGEYEYEVK